MHAKPAIHNMCVATSVLYLWWFEAHVRQTILHNNITVSTYYVYVNITELQLVWARSPREVKRMSVASEHCCVAGFGCVRRRILKRMKNKIRFLFGIMNKHERFNMLFYHYNEDNIEYDDYDG